MERVESFELIERPSTQTHTWGKQHYLRGTRLVEILVS